MSGMCFRVLLLCNLRLPELWVLIGSLKVDAYFSEFDLIATSLNWPKSLWWLVLQCELSGIAQEACSVFTESRIQRF